jgi:hypothetical protein
LDDEIQIREINSNEKELSKADVNQQMEQLLYFFFNDYSWLIAPTGQVAAQAPQSIQESASITN